MYFKVFCIDKFKVLIRKKKLKNESTLKFEVHFVFLFFQIS